MEEKKCCCAKTTSRSEEQKKKLLNRLKRIEGTGTRTSDNDRE